MRYAIERTVDPVVEPVTLGQAKAWLRVDASFTDDDDLISDLITEAREACEDWLSQAFITSTWRLTIDEFPLDWYGNPRYQQAGQTLWTAREIRLPRPPLQSVASLVYVDTTGATQTHDPTKYDVDARQMPGRIAPAYGQIWPIPRAQINAVQVTFVAGYGNGGSNVPACIKRAIKLLVADGYENREQTVGQLPTGVQMLLGLADHGSYIYQ